MNTVVACLVLVGGMATLVVFTMAVENWSRLIQPLPQLALDDGTDDVSDDIADDTDIDGRFRTDGTAGTDADGADDPVAVGVSPPSAGRPEGAVLAGAGSLQLRDAGTADVLAGLLFAAYAASRRAAADRAAAWVTAAAPPPSLDPTRFPAGVQLRGKPARVAELLLARDGGATWVTLQPSVDVAKGVARSPVKQATLTGLLSWWELSRSLPAVVRPGAAAPIAQAVEAVRPQLDDSAWTEPVGMLLAALQDAARSGESLLVGLGTAVAGPEPDPDAQHPDGQLPGAVDPPGPAVPADTESRSGS